MILSSQRIRSLIKHALISESKNKNPFPLNSDEFKSFESFFKVDKYSVYDEDELSDEELADIGDRPKSIRNVVVPLIESVFPIAQRRFQNIKANLRKHAISVAKKRGAIRPGIYSYFDTYIFLKAYKDQQPVFVLKDFFKTNQNRKIGKKAAASYVPDKKHQFLYNLKRIENAIAKGQYKGNEDQIKRDVDDIHESFKEDNDRVDKIYIGALEVYEHIQLENTWEQSIKWPIVKTFRSRLLNEILYEEMFHFVDIAIGSVIDQVLLRKGKLKEPYELKGDNLKIDKSQLATIASNAFAELNIEQIIEPLWIKGDDMSLIKLYVKKYDGRDIDDKKAKMLLTIPDFSKAVKGLKKLRRYIYFEPTDRGDAQSEMFVALSMLKNNYYNNLDSFFKQNPADELLLKQDPTGGRSKLSVLWISLKHDKKLIKSFLKKFKGIKY